MSKIEFVKSVDQFLGRAACALIVALFGLKRKSDAPAPDVPSTPSNILVIRPGGIGDAVLLFPLLDALKKKFPSCSLYILAEKRNASVFETNGLAEHMFLYDSFLCAGLWKALRTKFDIVVDTEQFHYSSAVVAFLTGAKVRCGFDTNARGHLFTHKASYSQRDHEVESFLALYRTLTDEPAAFDCERPFFPLDDRHRRRAQEAVAHLKGKRTAVVFTGASIPERRWPLKKYARVVSWLLGLEFNVVLCDAGAESLLPVALGKEARRDFVLALDGKASLAEIAGIAARSDLFLSSDTGILHLAYGVGTPTVSLFGPGIMEKWAPRGSRHLSVNRRVPCSPCTKFGTTPPCPNHLVCMEKITVEDVKEGLMRLLSADSGPNEIHYE